MRELFDCFAFANPWFAVASFNAAAGIVTSSTINSTREFDVCTGCYIACCRTRTSAYTF